MSDTPSNNRALATAAAASLAVFPVVVVGLNLHQAPYGYDARVQAISELALGPQGWLMNLAFCAGGAGTFLMALVFRRTTRAIVRPLLLTVAALGSVASAVFHADATGGATTTHGQIHMTVGLVVFVSELLTMAICAIRFRREHFWRPMLAVTWVLTLTGVAGFFCVPLLGQDNFGIAQRILVGSFVSWLIVAAVFARRDDESRPQTTQPRAAIAS